MDRERLVHPIADGSRNEVPRTELIEQWKIARYNDVYRYPAGLYTDNDGNTLYGYRAGIRLIILDQEVMDNCQEPWAKSTVDRAFAALKKKTDIQVLERGFGMGIVATRIMEHLRLNGGKYTCIELNDQVADYANTRWRSKQDSMARDKDTSVLGVRQSGKPNTEINIIRGEAFEETSKLAEEGIKFDIIVSDTYPLSDEERSVNDLLDLEQLIKCLAPDGIFAFFGFHEGSETGDLNAKQISMINKYFGGIDIDFVDVFPPKDYKYFNPPNGPVRRLPVVICTKPRLHNS